MPLSPSNYVIDNTSKERFEIKVGEYTAFAAYHIEANIVFIDYVESPPPLRGTGVAGLLMDGITTLVRQREQKIVPICSYAVSWMNRHPDKADLLGRPRMQPQ